MNESDIAAQVASRIPREPTVVAATQTTPVYQPQPGDEGYVFQNPLDEMSMYRIYDYFEVPMNERQDARTISMIDKLVEWAHQNGAVEYYDVIKAVREAQAITRNTSLKKAYEFAKLDMQSRRIHREMSALYG